MGAVDSSHPAKTVRLLWKKLMRIQKKRTAKETRQGHMRLAMFSQNKLKKILDL